MQTATAFTKASRGDAEAITHYHAHIYYDAGSREQAARLREAVATEFPEALFGRWHDAPVGPHPLSIRLPSQRSCSGHLCRG